MDIGVQTAALIMRHVKPLTMSSGQLLIPTRASDAQSPHGMDLLAEGDRSDDGTVRPMETRLVELRSGVRRLPAGLRSSPGSHRCFEW
jgi:hypothetical protein